MLQNIMLPIAIFLSAVFLTKMIHFYAVSKNILDIPNDRSSHDIPMPRGGGLSIVILFILLSIYFVSKNSIPYHLFYALCGGMLIALIGWIDDIQSMRAIWRIIVHFIAAMWAVYWLGGVPYLKGWPLAYIIGMITIVWCVNLYNFMDGIDGLAGTEGLFISLSAAFALGWMGATGISILCFLLAVIIGGFLILNWPPAKIFMGDVGSGYLGFVFAVLAIYTANLKLLPLSFWYMISAIFLCDATFTVLYRIYRDNRWYEAHREHAYQRLIQKGASHRTVTLNILFMNIFILFPLAYISLFYPQWNRDVMSISLFGMFVLWAVIQFR